MGTCVQPYYSLFLIFVNSLIGMILFIEILSFCDLSSESFVPIFKEHQSNMKLLSGRIMTCKDASGSWKNIANQGALNAAALNLECIFGGEFRSCSVWHLSFQKQVNLEPRLIEYLTYLTQSPPMSVSGFLFSSAWSITLNNRPWTLCMGWSLMIWLYVSWLMIFDERWWVLAFIFLFGHIYLYLFLWLCAKTKVSIWLHRKKAHIDSDSKTWLLRRPLLFEERRWWGNAARWTALGCYLAKTDRTLMGWECYKQIPSKEVIQAQNT